MQKFVYLCPVLPLGSCPWEGTREEVLPHFKHTHPDLLIESNVFRLDDLAGEKNQLMSYSEEVFLIQSSSVSSKIELTLRYLGSQVNAHTFNYYVVVQAGKYAFNNLYSDSYNPVRNNGPIIEIDMDILKMTSRGAQEVTCTLNLEISLKNLSRELSLKRSKRLAVSRNSSFTLQQICPEESYFVGENIDFVDKRYTDSDKLSLIKCSTCSDNMTSPIYMCDSGHSVCYQCKLKTCGVCGNSIHDFRNTDLEEESRRMRHPCRYNLCSTVLEGRIIREHEVQCKYTGYKCFVCCKKFVYSDAEVHFKMVHPSLRLCKDMIVQFPLDSHFVIISKSGIFECLSEKQITITQWTVRFCGSSQFFYECQLTIKGKKGHERKYVLRRKGNDHKLTLNFSEYKSLKPVMATLQIHALF
ncbi:PREDICTED: E3 ubiquitin-protein ligase siah-1-like [Nicrophorus vespilloides]|uniref:E3 ubiquitin-protein ligase siah-1-like n=1 Tax=Nicrophorus vespilloides TaxID=110193 RepID=A0ABM1N190_NICVS|nr:PREDICTED: E3 ubiquitin-protein ligase siah-1-like [Nicrophorus vespilloides]